jgi:hypothetical protein
LAKRLEGKGNKATVGVVLEPVGAAVEWDVASHGGEGQMLDTYACPCRKGHDFSLVARHCA